MKSNKIIIVAVVAVSLLLIISLAIFFTNKQHHIETNAPLPDFQLSHFHDKTQVFTPQDMQGKYWLLNTWASWCRACTAEHPALKRLASEGYPIIGINHQDTQKDAKAWLKQHGNPYTLIISDDGDIFGNAIKTFGIPETYFIDKDGIVRYKHIGPISITELNMVVRPLLLKYRTTN